MRVVLVSTPTRTYAPNTVAPAGIMSLAAYLESRGHSVSIVDAAALREPNGAIVARVAACKPDLVGVGGIITAYAYIIALTRDLKAAMPGVPIVLGGQVVINNADLCFEKMGVDYAVHGYGEIALEKLVRHIEGRLAVERIPGVAYRRGGAVLENPGREFFRSLDELPLPAYHLVDMEHYATVNGAKFPKLQKYLEATGKTVENHRHAVVMGTLGCTDRCSFCVHEQEFVGLKLFSNAYLLRHMEHLHKAYGIHIFTIGEEMFLTTLERAAEFNRLMKERLPGVYWSASTRANWVTPELVRELSDGNCCYIGWGFESGSRRMLALMRKRVTREVNIRAYRAIDSSKIVAATALMVGNAGEDHASVLDTVSAVREAGIASATVFFAAPYPGSRSWDWALERGLIRDRHEYLLRASDRDAATTIACNMTPYPDFILRAWQQLVYWACLEEESKKEFRVRHAVTLPQRLKRWLRLRFGFYLVPSPMVPPLVRAYFAWDRLSRRLFRTRRDLACACELDADGGLKVAAPNVGGPQRSLSEAELEALFAAGPRKASGRGGPP